MSIAEALYAAQAKAASIPAGNKLHCATIDALLDAAHAAEETENLAGDTRILHAFALLWRVVLGTEAADPLPALLAEWAGTRADLIAAEDAADAAEARKRPDAATLRQRATGICGAIVTVENAIIATRPTTLLGLLAKIRLGNLYMGDDLATGRIQNDDAAPEHGIRLALERDLAGLLGIALPQPAGSSRPLPIAAE